MNLNQIKSKALEEEVDIADWITLIQRIRNSSPLGMDFSLPENVIDHVEAYCDARGIPFYHVAETTCSTAINYNNLYTHEKCR